MEQNDWLQANTPERRLVSSELMADLGPTPDLDSRTVSSGVMDISTLSPEASLKKRCTQSWIMSFGGNREYRAERWYLGIDSKKKKGVLRAEWKIISRLKKAHCKKG
jgi:hypothetical protein